MSKPRVDPTFGISSVDVLILTERRPACRWREAQPGSCKERENLAGDAKGKGPSGANRKAESTDAPARGGPLRSVCWVARESGGPQPLSRRDGGPLSKGGGNAFRAGAASRWRTGCPERSGIRRV